MDTPAGRNSAAPLHLHDNLQDPHEYVRITTLAELLAAPLPPEAPIEAVAICIDDPSESVRDLAVIVLGQAGARVLSHLVRALDDKQSVPARIAAASALARLGQKSAPAMQQLDKCLDAPDDLLRWHASFALSKIGPASIPLLMNRLSSSVPAIQCAAANALGWIGSGAKNSAEAVKKLASSSSPAVRLACHSALIRILGDPSAGLPAMLSALDDRDENVRQAAVKSLGELGPLAKQSASKLLSMMADPSAAVRAEIALALARIQIGDSQVVRGLTGLLQDPVSEVRGNAGIALGKLGPSAQTALPALQAMQSGDDPRLAAIAGAAVKSINQRAI